MAHVAEAAEASGRLILLVEPGTACVTAAAASAVRFAAAFAAELEVVFVNLDAVARASALPVGKLAAPDVNVAGAMDRAVLSYALVPERHWRNVFHAASRAHVTVTRSSVSGDAVDQLDLLSQARGPWNIVVLSQPAYEGTGPLADLIFANCSGVTGIVGVPQVLPDGGGPIVIAVEDVERLPAMLRAAGRLKGLCERVYVRIVAQTRKESTELEAQVRLMTAHLQGIELQAIEAGHGLAGAHDEALRALRPSFVIARHGGTLLPDARALARSIRVMRAPVLLVR